MFTSIIYSKDKVFLDEEYDGVFEEDYQDNILSIIKVKNEIELMEDNKAELQDELQDNKDLIKSLLPGFICFLSFMMGLEFSLILIFKFPFLITALLGVGVVTIRAFRFGFKQMKLESESEKLKEIIACLSFWIDENKVMLAKLEENKTKTCVYEDVKVKNLTAYNNERRYLLERKLQLLRDFLSNTEVYKQMVEDKTIDREIPNQELNSFVRSLVKWD